jgi:hypothetical protein
MAAYSFGRPDRYVNGSGGRWFLFSRKSADGKAIAGPFPSRKAAIAADRTVTDPPADDVDALAFALALAISAPSDSKSADAVALADSIAGRLSADAVAVAKRRAVAMVGNV